MDNKNDEFDNDKLPTIITIICVLFSFYLAFSTNIGNDYDNALRINLLFSPPFMIIICFLIPAINKDYKIFWSKKNIIIMIIGLLITIPIFILYSINRYKTLGYWH